MIIRIPCYDTPENLRLRGPCLKASIQRMDQTNSPMGITINECMALIDTGAAESCLSIGMAEKLGISSERVYRFEGGSLQPVDRFQCRIYLGGLSIINDFIIYPYAKPSIDIIIGTNILERAILTVDFITGHWAITFDL